VNGSQNRPSAFDTLTLNNDQELVVQINRKLANTSATCEDFIRTYQKKHPTLNRRDLLEQILYDIKRDQR